MSAERTHHSRNRILSVLAAGAVLLAGGLGTGDAGAADVKPAKVRAVYNITFNGFGIGEFALRANLGAEEYSLAADANISVLAGMVFEWTGKTTSSGHIVHKGPAPYNYSFGYKTAEKGERIDVKFNDNVVREIAVNPPQRPVGQRVPVTRQHMQNVVDPLSAALILSNVGSDKTGSDVCNQRMPIFDGKARYDLVLSYKRTKSVETEVGYTGPAYVCKVKFVPIAGHKMADNENTYAARNEGMEIWLVPIHRAGIYLPYYVNIPTPMGAATLTASSFDVDLQGGGKRALSQ